MVLCWKANINIFSVSNNSLGGESLEEELSCFGPEVDWL